MNEGDDKILPFVKPALTCFILTEHECADNLKLKTAYENNNFKVSLGNIQSLTMNPEVYWTVIVLLDHMVIRDCEEFKELLCEKATRILVVCSQSMQRLVYYSDFLPFTNVDGLLEREFFAFSTQS